MDVAQTLLHYVAIGAMTLASIFVASWAVQLLIWGAEWLQKTRQNAATTCPVSVNYHFTRKCNYSCEFCFHTAKSSYILPLERAKEGLRLLQGAGMRKINFAGGEPFLHQKTLAKLLRFCKESLQLESVSIVSNASKISEPFLRSHGQYIDIIAVSCDSFDEATNKKIGRYDGAGAMQVAHLHNVADWCRQYNIKLKLNTVVCSYNVDEDMSAAVAELAPFRWKVFQVLLVKGENDSEKTLRDTRNLLVTDAAFDAFCKRHAHLACLVPEPNRLMKSSYLILDEYMCFLDKDNDGKSASILDIGVQAALSQIHWDEEAFVERGGLYDWTKEGEGGGGCGGSSDELQQQRLKDLEF